MARRIPAIVLAVCAACGGGNQTFATGSASVNGTIGGQTMTPKDAISAAAQGVGTIVISTADTHCAKINARQTPKNLQAIIIGIGTQASGSSTPPAAPGVFPVYSGADSVSISGPAAVALFLSTSATCQLTTQGESATGGNVTLTRVDASGYAGTFDITFSGTAAGHITGSFTSAQCAPLASAQGGTCT